jgi:hypothetical protein
METIFPYGIKTKVTLGDVGQSLLPTWMSWMGRGLTETDPSSRSTLNYTLNHLASTPLLSESLTFPQGRKVW